MIFIREIQQEVANHYGVPVAIMTGRTNLRVHAWPRQTAMVLATRLTEQSLVNIGRLFGHRHHTTIIHALRPNRRNDNEAMRLITKRLLMKGGAV